MGSAARQRMRVLHGDGKRHAHEQRDVGGVVAHAGYL
jgi:hypothetical protein